MDKKIKWNLLRFQERRGNMQDLITTDNLIQVLGVISTIQTVKSYRIKRKIRRVKRVVKAVKTLVTWLMISGVILLIASYII